MDGEVQEQAPEPQTEPEAPQEGDVAGEAPEGLDAPENAPGAADAAQPQGGIEDGQVSVECDLGRRPAAQPGPGGSPEDQPPSKEELQQLREEEVAFGWQASEFVHHHKGMNWYAGLATGVAILVGIAALLHQWIDIVLFAMV